MSLGQGLGLVGGLIGTAFGGPLGGSIGFLVGSLLGNLIDPPKVEGPRRTDLKLQRSEYGAVIPFVWGTGRIAGNVIDQTDLQEHKEKSGGKGGPEVTNYTYSASFMVALATARVFGDQAIRGIKQIFADGRLIWDITSGEDMPCTLYSGTEDQDPDPTFEAIHGVGSVPAYRGLAYVVFADYPLADYGDRIPQLEFVVFTEVGDYPYRIASFDPQFDVSTYQMRCLGATYSGGEITLGMHFRPSYGNAFYAETHFDINGTKTSDTTIVDPADGLGGAPVSNALFAPGFSSNDWFYQGTLATPLAVPISGALDISVGQTCAQVGYYIYTITSGTSKFVERWPINGGNTINYVSDAFAVVGLASDANSAFIIGTSNEDKVYVTTGLHAGSPGEFWLYEFDPDLTTYRRWDLSGQYAVSPIVNGSPFAVYRSPTSGDLILACDRGTGGNKQIYCFILGDDLSVTPHAGVSRDSTAGGAITLLGNGPYMLIGDGVICLEPPDAPVELSVIVSELSQMTPLSSGDIDVVELTDLVRWFFLGTQTTVRNAYDPLRKCFFFDAVEEDDLVAFRKRGDAGSPSKVIHDVDDDDLCGREYGADGDTDPLRTTRNREQGLPRTVTMRYIDVGLDYQTGAQTARRLATLSQQDVSFDVNIGFEASEALQKTEALLVAEWVERENPFEWQTTVKYAHLSPCDLVNVRGRDIRVTQKTESPNGVIQWQGVLHQPSIYTQEQTASAGDGFTQQETPAARVETQLILLDIPILSQNDAPFGFYAAMGPARDGPWPGATLYKSLDGGLNYFAVASTSVPDVIGITTSNVGSPMGSPAMTGTLASYSGGDVVDESSLCVLLTDDDAELSSCTATALENGANMFALSSGIGGGSPATLQWEILQFRDATQIADKMYVISGFKRGRYGTSTAGHDDGDTFVLLPCVNVDAPESELNLLLKYKAVTFGKTLADTGSQDFINTGEAADAYFGTESANTPSPVDVVTATTYTGAQSDNGRWKVFNNASGVTFHLPSTLKSGWYCFVDNIGAGSVTLDAGSSTIDGGGHTLILTTNQGVILGFDGSNFYTMRGMGSTSGSGSPSGSGGITGITLTQNGVFVQADTTTLNVSSTVRTYGPSIYVAGSGGGVGQLISDAAHYLEPYLTWQADTSSLPNSLGVSAGAGISVSIVGGSPATSLEIANADHTKSIVTATTEAGLPNARKITAGSNIGIQDNGAGSTLVISSTVSSGGVEHSQEFTADGTFTVPDGVTLLRVTMIGGGGGGASRNAAASGGGGGGSGEQCIDLPVPVPSVVGSPSLTIAVSIGAAGTGAVGAAANVAGGNGGTTSFGSYFSVLGGNGGTTAGVGGAGGGSIGGAGGTAGNPGVVGSLGSVESGCHFGGSGGSGGGSTTAANGGAGRAGPGFSTGTAGGATASTQAGGGSGAGTQWGQGGAGGAGGAAGSAPASTAYGAGGGGAGGKAATGPNGGDGAKGYCLVTWIA